MRHGQLPAGSCWRRDQAWRQGAARRSPASMKPKRSFSLSLAAPLPAPLTPDSGPSRFTLHPRPPAAAPAPPPPPPSALAATPPAAATRRGGGAVSRATQAPRSRAAPRSARRTASHPANGRMAGGGRWAVFSRQCCAAAAKGVGVKGCLGPKACGVLPRPSNNFHRAPAAQRLVLQTAGSAYSKREEVRTAAAA